MSLPHPNIGFLAPLQPVQILCSGIGGEIDSPYIRCLDGRVTSTYELWVLAEDRVREVYPYAIVRLLSEFREDTFHTNFFNARRFQIPFLGCRSVKKSVEFIDVVRTTQHV